MIKTEGKVHASVYLPTRMHRALMVKLAREGRTLSEFLRDAVESYVAPRRN